MDIILLVWIPLCAVVGYVASQKGRSGWGMFFLSLIFSPILGLLVVIALPAQVVTVGNAPRAKDLVRCWSCTGFRVAGTSSWLPACPHCGAGAKPENNGTKKCPACAETIKAEATKCRYCNEVFAPGAPESATPLVASSNWRKIDDTEKALDQRAR